MSGGIGPKPTVRPAKKPIAKKATALDEVDYTRTSRISDSHATTSEEVAIVLVVIMAFRPNGWSERATQSALTTVAVKIGSL